MAKASVLQQNPDIARHDELLEAFTRRIAATPQGACPITTTAALITASAAQSCGKCVPCRNGLPQLARLLHAIAACDASALAPASALASASALAPAPAPTLAEALARARALAQTINDTADCAIGYEAARAALASFDAFAAEYRAHIENGTCQDFVGITVPCETDCPAHVDVPAYIAHIAAGNYADAIATIRKDNPFPTACAYVCEHPCETRCRRTLIDAPLNIRGLKKFAVDQVPANKVPTPAPAANTNRRVACVGGGPSGLTCAYYLSLMGHNVTVYEMHERLGGMMRYGIPAYRFPRERLDEDLNAILGAGNIEVVTNTTIGAPELRDLTERFDAVYVSIGAHAGKRLSIGGADAAGVMSAVELLGAIGDGNHPNFAGKRVAIIGGGNVAMDCARTAVRLGAAEVNVIYRRRREDMTALPAEVDAAVAEGVELVTLAAPIAIETDAAGNAIAVIVQPQMVGAVRSGRPAPQNAAKPTECIAADIVILAVGQDVASAPFADAGMQTNRGCFTADAYQRAAGFTNLFVGGECVTGPKTVIKAIAAGRAAARNIDDFLGFNHTLPAPVATPQARSNDRTPRGRVQCPERPARLRRLDFDAVETEMTQEEAVQECSRCLRCDVFGSGCQQDGRVQNA